MAGLYSLNMAAGLAAFSSRPFALNHGPFQKNVRIYRYSGRRMPPAERYALYHNGMLSKVYLYSGNFWRSYLTYLKLR